MHILVTNDDGIEAKGIKVLVESLKELGKITVIAPSSEKSACGHGITVRDSIKVKNFTWSNDILAYSVDGTPADCVKVGIQAILDEAPDIIVSGINKGPNLGTDVLYSGTVSAAVEGVILGIPAIAMSLDSYDSEDFNLAGKVARLLVKKMLTNKVTHDTLLNVNVPDINESEINGFKVTRLGERKYENEFKHEVDSEGNSYYWLNGKVIPSQYEDEDLDIVAVRKKYISITPIHFDLTNYKIMDQVKKWDIKNKDI